MAEEQTQLEANTPPAKKSSGGVLWAVIWGTIGLVCGAGGFALPLYFPAWFGMAVEKPQQVAEKLEDREVKTTYIDFGESVVNINSDRLNRYLRLHLMLMVKADDLTKVEHLVEERRSSLKSWLISYLSDVSMEDLRGAAGQNRLRREIQDHFNTVLFEDGYDRIREVLFEEFNVQ
jgi:flagellar basal body-associated protein FliL